VLLSETLNWDLHVHGVYARRVMDEMFRLCRHGVAFNMLDARHVEHKALGDLYAYHPHDILKYCQTISPHCQWIEGYLDNGFSIYMRR